MDTHQLIMDTCDLITIVNDKYVYIHRSIMIFMIEVSISIFSVRDVNGLNAKSE